MTIREAYMPELNLMFETFYVLWMFRLFYRILRHQYLVYAFHRRQALRYTVPSLRKVLQRVDNRVQHHHIINKDRARQRVVVQYQYPAKPQYNHNQYRAQKF